jgi:hypothetical protein
LESGENVIDSLASVGIGNKKNIRLFGNMDVTRPTASRTCRPVDAEGKTGRIPAS